MANRTAFIDFAQGLLNLNPLERWTPAQARLHPFITQQKFTGPFVPPMTLRASSSKSPAPGVQEQQRAEAASKQRAAQQVQMQQQQQQHYANMQMQYAQTPHAAAQQSPGAYNMYSPSHQGAPPPYPAQSGFTQQPMPMIQPGQSARYTQQPNLYAQATTRAGRQRASTLDQQQSGVPLQLQRVISHLDPNAPIRLQPSPAYYPPPPDGAPDASGNRRRTSRTGQGRSNRDFIRNLEDRTLEEGYMNTGHWG